MIRKTLHITIIFSIFIFLISTNHLVSQWEKITNIPSGYIGNYWLDVFFLSENPQYGWICGYNGKVIRSTDGGNSWEGSTLLGVDQLESIHFASKLVGYTSGNGRIYKSIDGGVTWENVSPVSGAVLWGCYFIDEDNGGVIGGGCNDNEFQSFFRTTDGGNTWSLFQGSEPLSGLSDLILYDDGTGYASSSGRIWKTTDSGFSWYIFSVSGNNDWQEEITHYNQSFLVPYSNGCSGSTGISSGGGVRFTTNNGVRWLQRNTGKPMFGAFLLDSLRGWACGHSALALFTSDGGVNWEKMNCGIDKTDDLDDIWFINDTLGFLVGDNVYRYFVIEKLNPKILASGSNFICEGDSVMLYPEKDYNYYSWSNGSKNKKIWISQPGKYYLTVNNNLCDTATSNVIEVFFYPKPNPEIQSSQGNFICRGDSTILFCNDNYLSYNWSTGDTTKSILVKEEGYYELIVLDSNGCEGTDDFFLKTSSIPYIQSTNGNIFCQGDSTILTTDIDYSSYNWSTGDTTKSILVKEEGYYELIVVDSNGCKGINGFNINLYPLPEPIVTFKGDSIICDDDFVLLKTIDEYISYKWYDENDLEIQTENNYGKINKSGKYKVVVTDSNGCSGESDFFDANIVRDSNHLIIKYLPQKQIFIIDTTNIIALNCDSLEIYNNSSHYSTINDMYLFDGTEFSIPLSQFPFILEPYSSKKIQICVSPAKLGVIRDTILCPDICSNHIIPLETFSIPNTYIGVGNCNIRIKLETNHLYSKGFIINQPYPNPAQNIVEIDFFAEKDNNSDFKINSEIFDIFGNKRLEADISYEVTTLQENKSFVIGKILFNLKNLENGLFIIVVRNEFNSVVVQLIINK